MHSHSFEDTNLEIIFTEEDTNLEIIFTEYLVIMYRTLFLMSWCNLQE